MSRPSTYKQKSKKGKKAWRKNIDIDEIEEGLKKAADSQILHGKSNIEDLEDDKLFTVDIEGDLELKKKLIKRKQIKKNIKSTEILESIKTTSKVEALTHPKKVNNKKTVQGVSKKRLQKLLEISGKKSVSTLDKLSAILERDGLIKTNHKNSTDLWDDHNDDQNLPNPSPSYLKLKKSAEKNLPQELLRKSTSSWSTATVAPNTLKIGPSKVKEYEDIPHAGKSYNPHEKDWKLLLDKEYTSEKKREDIRIAMEQYKCKIKHLMETLQDAEEEDDEESDNEEEEEKEGENTENNAENITRLSVNEPVKNKKKTKYQRNKQRKHKERIRLQNELKALKKALKEYEILDNLEKGKEQNNNNGDDVTTDNNDTTTKNNTNSHTSSKVEKKHKLGSKHTVLDETLEVKFKDELNGSLRKLRPEGNLLYDNLRKLQSSGKIEARKPIKKGRKYKPKITAKWTHKDFT
ncbi:related to Ribosome biogenesis protein NOP53 [Saccharomycodes ludwigii]|uniref:Ribosome biogenesis protein NOP53 n=1 Tax=Saccharomycodes ludwigii TaxID=36035 RepID=A0A376B1F7_9ASCO|nr:hypothetical protein SCDLUD_002141 [Saccharomycodes ludwigii]KAH3902321.1 hypothetical protein SCDLUD_002141 [Saccharomycodes ludwigii]SSD58518.1 related to Ribosome biogenesis protein NOP53 [Saccharomycodes ludwigii]